MLNDRQNTILSYISEHGEAKNAELLSLIGDYSTMTLWRDLTKLEQDGHILRVRGGAVVAQEVESGRETNFVFRSRQNANEKASIVDIARHFVTPNHAYYFDAGTTVFMLAGAIDVKNQTIVTSAANTAVELSRRGYSNVTLIGGQINYNTLACSGYRTEEQLDGMNIDVAILSTSGYSESGGFTIGYNPEAEVKRRIIKKSSFVVMLMDHDKIDKSHPFTFAGLSDVDILVGDSKLPESFLNAAKEKGVTVFTPDSGLDSDEFEERFNRLFLAKRRGEVSSV